MEALLKALQYKYRYGESLFNIFEEIKSTYNRSDAQTIFHCFIKKNQKNEKFMTEFNSTVFSLV